MFSSASICTSFYKISIYPACRLQMYQFTSAKKMASVLLHTNNNSLLLLNKGAAEWVLAKCDRVAVTDANGRLSIQPLDEVTRAQLMDTVVGMASRGLRCICLATRELPGEDPTRPANFFESSENLDVNMTAVAIVGIKDPVRAEVPAAVATCQKAGIVVRMVTGEGAAGQLHCKCCRVHCWLTGLRCGCAYGDR
jgi:Ca2+-transporting ATPase